MTNKKKKFYLKKQVFLNIVILLIISIAVYLGYNLFFGPSTLSNVIEEDRIWDGKSVATKFSGGNGTYTNPYQIKNGKEFAYFKQIIEGEENNVYANKYYELSSDIDLGGHAWNPIGTSSGGNNNIFKGTLNGNGYTIKNAIVENAISMNNERYYGIFSLIENATIENLNIENIKIQAKSSGDLTIGTLAGKAIGNKGASIIRNVSLKTIDLAITKETETKNNIGLILGQSSEILIKNAYIQGNITPQANNSVGTIIGNDSSKDSTVENVITNVLINGVEEKQYGTEGTIKSVDIYRVVTENETQKIVALDLTETSEAIITEKFNKSLSSSYEWVMENNVLTLVKYETPNIQLFAVDTTINSVEAPESGITTTTVNINDIEKDWNYYMGLNYTSSENGTLPTEVDKKIYTEKNLVKAAVTYSSIEEKTNGTVIGYVSASERQNKYAYYKVYPVNTNNSTNLSDDYIEIELIDNPFTDRPTNMGFNGWITADPNAEIYFDEEIYTRYARVPVTYTNNIPNDVVINFDAIWTPATVAELPDNVEWETAIDSMKTAGMQLAPTKTITYEPFDMTGYFLAVTLSRGASAEGYYNASGVLMNYTNTCTQRRCTYYELIEGEYYDEETTYYELNGTMQVLDPSTLDRVENVEINPAYINAHMAGYFLEKNVARYESYAGLYDSDGVLQSSGTCNTNGGCTYYELIPYYDSDGNKYLMNENETYYYLATRDTNIIVMTESRSDTWDEPTLSKPFTLTSLHNQENYISSATWTVRGLTVYCYDDMTIENITITTNYNAGNTEPAGTGWLANDSNHLFGMYNNVKLGRGIKSPANTTYRNFRVVVGGSQDDIGSEGNISRYKLMIESGFYNSLSLTNGAVGNGAMAFLEMYGIYGNDYDRVDENNNNLDVSHCAAGSWGGVYYASTEYATTFNLTVKSGQFGSGKYEYTSGIYVGGLTGGTHNASRKIIYEGGYTYNLIGGPITASTRSAINDTYMYIKGGKIDLIVGGAGRSATYGNRIIQVTGGTINYSVFGGSNGVQGSGSDGTLLGTPYIYIGGDAKIGDENLVTNGTTLFGAEAGSVFGIGNGRSNSTTIGSADNSIIIINEDATINRNVYGGGNYGAVGISNDNISSNYTHITMLNGTIKGDIYGGGNRNGSGSEDIESTIEIKMLNGTVEGNIYGGSNYQGTIYGNVNVYVEAGNITNDVYGGGKGGIDDEYDGTFVTGNVNVTIGKKQEIVTPTINGYVYGGSAFGTVNGAENTTNLSEYDTKVVVNNGVIANAVFGGGKGSVDYTPYVEGDIAVTINGGNIGEVYGGNDAAGIPNGSVYVYLYGGIVGTTYGGGNNAGVNVSNVLLDGGKSDYIYGGSNNSGTVTTTNVTVNNGNTIDVYGGGNKASSGATNVTINGTKINRVFGGGNQAGAETTNVVINDGVIEDVFGGSNQLGDVGTSNVTTNYTETKDVELQVKVTETPVTWQQTTYKNVATIAVTIKNNSSKSLTKYDGNLVIPNSELDTNYSAATINKNGDNYSFNQKNSYYDGTNVVQPNGTFEFSFTVFTDYSASEICTEQLIVGTLEDGTSVSYRNIDIRNIYGGNNLGGTTNTTKLSINNTLSSTIFGGGNEAPVGSTDVDVTNSKVNDVYGGGNQAEATGNTTLDVTSSIVNNSIYGGGNAGVVVGNTTLSVKDSTINASVYGGGNKASVLGNTLTNISGKTKIKESVFGGGNQGAIGTEDANNSTSTVNISAGTIGKNVYGGCNTSVVYGETYVNIGANATTVALDRNDISIGGTIFGGGEANASGSETYDFTFISVTKAIDIVIDGSGYLDENYIFEMKGSIFGSGNASSSSGTSNILIKQLGTKSKPSKNISIQRADNVIIDGSVIELAGTTDRTNELVDYKYSFNRIKMLKLKNNANLLLRENANLLESFYSVAEIDGVETKATVEIDNEDRTVVKNVDNRLYMLAGQALNVAINENATAYGVVSGMTFLGMYEQLANGEFQYGMYSDEYGYGSEIDGGDIIVGGTYVLGLHNLNHDITVDGFYSNFSNDDFTELSVAYINPTPPDADHYKWSIGISSINYEFNLVAAKYSSLGTYELSLLDFSAGNTKFTLLGFNSDGLNEGVEMIDGSQVPQLAATPEEANSLLGLSMKAETTEWTGHRTTKLLSADGGTITGDKIYQTDSQSTAPSIMFYLYHAKNISLEEKLGTVVVRLQAETPKNAIETEDQLITITINLEAKAYDDGNAYDASITYGRKYEMPLAVDVNITNRSQFTLYYSLFAMEESFQKIYGDNNEYYHTLVSSYALPVGTKITMIDNGRDTNNPGYYYYIIDEDDYQESVNELSQNNEITYELSKFIRMGSTSTNNIYSDSDRNVDYFETGLSVAIEEFIFIVDLEDTTTTETSVDNSMLFELRNSENRTVLSVLGPRQNFMKYSLYDSSNVVLNQKIEQPSDYFYYNETVSVGYTTSVDYLQTGGREQVIDTNYESSSMGLNIALYNEQNEQVSSSLLSSTSIIMDGVVYHSDANGVFRMKLSDKVSNLSKTLEITVGSELPVGKYKLKYSLFASSDGLHSTGKATVKEFDITVVGSDNLIIADSTDTVKIVDRITGTNLDKNNKEIYTITYKSVLSNPNIRVSLYKRDVENWSDITYQNIDMSMIFSTTLKLPSSLGLTTDRNYEYIVTITPEQNFLVQLDLKENIKSGTYRVVFSLYDENHLVDEDIEYIIVK